MKFHRILVAVDGGDADKDTIQLPTPTTALEAGDRVVVVGDRASEEGLHRALTGS